MTVTFSTDGSFLGGNELHHQDQQRNRRADSEKPKQPTAPMEGAVRRCVQQAGQLEEDGLKCRAARAGGSASSTASSERISDLLVTQPLRLLAIDKSAESTARSVDRHVDRPNASADVVAVLHQADLAG